MTYIPIWMGFLYLAVFIAVWSRRVVGWAMGEHMTTDLMLTALNMRWSSANLRLSSNIRIKAAITPAWPLVRSAYSCRSVLRWEQ